MVTTAYEVGNSATDSAMREMLEGFVDRWTIAEVLEALDAITSDKENHLISNWQDNASARAWERVGRRIEIAAKEARESGI